MSASHSSVELQGIPRDPFEPDSGDVKGASSQSIPFEIEESFHNSDDNSIYHPTEFNGETPLRPTFRPPRQR